MINQTPTEIDITIPLLIFVIIFSIAVLILSIICLYLYIQSKIHDSYHKGFIDSMKENISYYKTLKDLTDSFGIIFNMFYKDEVKVKVELGANLIDFKDKLIDYSNK